MRTEILTALLTATLCAPAWAQSSKAGSYQIDATHSKVGFEVPHLVISTVEGRFTQFEGKIDLDEKFDKSRVDAKVDLKSIDTGVPRRDEHLRSADFFDVAKHPTMIFKSTSLKGTEKSFQLTGDLTLKGVTKKVTFDGKYLGTVKDGFGNEKVAFEAKTRINRKDFGLTWNNMVEAGPVVGDEVTIALKIQGARPVVKQAAAQ